MEFWRYYGTVRRRWWVPAVLALVAVVAVTAILWFRPPTYASTATLMVRTPAATNSVVLFSPSEGGLRVTDQVSLVKTDIVTILSSPAFVQRVAQRFPDRHIPGRYQVTAIPNTSLLNVTGSGPTPRTAHRIARTVTDEFVRFYKDLNRRDAAESRAFLEDQVRRARAQLEAADRALQRYRAAHRVPALDEQVTRAVNVLAQYEVERDLADAAARQARARIAAARRGAASQPPTRVASETVVENPRLQQLRTRLTELEIQLTEARQVFTDEHPKVIALRSEIAELRARLPREVARVVGTQTVSTNPLHQRMAEETIVQTVEYTAAVARRDAMAAAAARIRAQLPRLSTAQRELTALLREQRAAEERYALLSGKLNEAVIKEQQAAYETVSVREVAAPVLPLQPVPTPRAGMLAAALALALTLGVGMAFFLDYLEGAVRTPAEAQRAFGLPVLGVIPEISPRVHRQLTLRARPAWQTTSLLLLAVVVVAAALALGIRLSFAQEGSWLWPWLAA